VSYADLFSLQGKTALITGGAGYFGQQFVRGLLDCGAIVVVVEKPGTTNPFANESRVDWRQVDLYDRVATDHLYDKVLYDAKHVDILINNAFEFSPRTGFAKDFALDGDVFGQSTYEHLQTSFESGIWWAFQATKKFGPTMKRRATGSIINIASPYGVIAPSPLTYKGFGHTPNPPGYGIIKAGLLQLTRYAAAWLAPVRVNALLPGAIPNLKEKPERAGKSYKDNFLDKLAERMILGRVGKVEELVGPLIFLASDASNYVTAQALHADGGWTQI
jgi:NAD(P)-dependent dehydrogenase (short-subunit alcohol dehydrogenase family)